MKVLLLLVEKLHKLKTCLLCDISRMCFLDAAFTDASVVYFLAYSLLSLASCLKWKKKSFILKHQQMAVDVSELRAKITKLGIIRRIKLLSMYIMIKTVSDKTI